jgi:hypothetical protein
MAQRCHWHRWVTIDTAESIVKPQKALIFWKAELNQSNYGIVILLRPFCFLNFKGTPSQEKHKTILSNLSKINWLSGQSDAMAVFSKSAILSVTHWLLADLKFREVNFLKLSRVKPSYRATAAMDRIHENPVSHLTETQKCQKVNLISQSYLMNH